MNPSPGSGHTRLRTGIPHGRGGRDSSLPRRNEAGAAAQSSVMNLGSIPCCHRFPARRNELIKASTADASRPVALAGLGDSQGHHVGPTVTASGLGYTRIRDISAPVSHQTRVSSWQHTPSRNQPFQTSQGQAQGERPIFSASLKLGTFSSSLSVHLYLPSPLLFLSSHPSVLLPKEESEKYAFCPLNCFPVKLELPLADPAVAESQPFLHQILPAEFIGWCSITLIKRQ